MMITQFEDIIAWQEARNLCKQVYALTNECHDRGFCDQIQRAAVSIMNNIAEGFDRNVNDKDNATFIHFLGIAYASTGEVKSMCYLANDLGYISAEQASAIQQNCKSISNKIYSLIQFLRNNPHPQSNKKTTNNKTTK